MFEPVRTAYSSSRSLTSLTMQMRRMAFPPPPHHPPSPSLPQRFPPQRFPPQRFPPGGEMLPPRRPSYHGGPVNGGGSSEGGHPYHANYGLGPPPPFPMMRHGMRPPPPRGMAMGGGPHPPHSSPPPSPHLSHHMGIGHPRPGSDGQVTAASVSIDVHGSDNWRVQGASRSVGKEWCFYVLPPFQWPLISCSGQRFPQRWSHLHRSWWFRVVLSG